jgi:hypothetical protein
MLEVKVSQYDYKRILNASGAAFESGRPGYFERAKQYLVRRIAERQLPAHEASSRNALRNDSRALMEMLNGF